MGLLKAVHRELARWKRKLGRLKTRRELERRRTSPQKPVIDPAEEAVLFFAPDAGIQLHFDAICLAARTLQELGHRVYVAQCAGHFARCTIVDSHALPLRFDQKIKRNMCLDCLRNSLDVLKQNDLPALELGAFLTPDIRDTVDRALAAAPDNLLEFEYDGINFGKLCCVDVSLSMKRSEFETVRGDDRQQWCDYIASSLSSYLAVDRILQQMPIKAVVYFNDLSLAVSARLAAQKHGVPATTMSLAYHCNVDRRRLGLYNDAAPLHRDSVLKRWPQWRNLALAPERIRDLGDDLIFRLRGSGHTIYSPARNAAGDDLLARLGLARDKPLVVAYTSSKDELGAGRMLAQGANLKTPAPTPQPFVDQVEWLEHVCEFVGRRDDLQLVVRVHPREGASARIPRPSDHLRQLQQAFAKLPANCRFIWPQDSFSSYDLGELANLALVSWSSIGLEFARLGVPVLGAFNVFEVSCPPDSFVRFVETKQEYFSCIDELLERPSRLETLAAACRWHNLIHLETTLDFSDVLSAARPTKAAPFQLSRRAQALESVILESRHATDINREHLHRAQTPIAAAAEQAELLRQIRRIVHFLFTGEDSQGNLPLVVSNANSRLNQAGETRDDCRLTHRGPETTYHAHETSYRRYSPMIARLARLLQTEFAAEKRAA